MAAAAARLLGGRLRGGIVIGPVGAVVAAPLEAIEGGHPVPTSASEAAGRRALAIAQATAPDEALLVLLSGGASALMAAPAGGVTLADKRRATEVLLRSGADIHALNTVRKHLSAVKGGWLAAAARGPCRTLVISDVVGDDLSVIASGPTVADASTFADALDVLRRHDETAACPRAVVDRLTRGAGGEVAETPKPGDRRLQHSRCWVIGRRHDAMAGAAAEAGQRGYSVRTLDAPIVGEARIAARAHIADVSTSHAAGAKRPLCVISSGETTVHVTGSGRGGRNQEFALAAADLSSSLGDCAALASVGTDGVDGPTDAAGAIVDSRTVVRAAGAGLDRRAYLDDNDSYRFFAALDDLIRTGPTGTNVGDLQVILVA
jgi:glycerate 2-kinase